MNKKTIILVLSIVVVVIGGVIWYIVQSDSLTNNNATVNSTTATSNVNVSGIPQSEEYIFVFGVDPSSGAAAGGEKVTLQGSGFIEGLKVFFGDNEASAVTFTNGETLTVTTPKGEGKVNVKIVNPDGRSGILYDGYIYN
ncbi:MAG: IPT/TIG domain-containing protein [Patescibacteria group bacterium]|jgi:hypothetical protein